MRVEVSQEVADTLPVESELETCDNCGRVAEGHTVVDGWLFCLPENNDTALVSRSPNLGKLAREAAANRRMFAREDAADGRTEGSYPRRNNRR